MPNDGVFSAPTWEWFRSAFEAPTAAQEQAWPAIASGEHVLISAPTGSGKTLAAFLYAIDQLARRPRPEHARDRRIGLVYVSPLKALSYDIARHLRTPLRGIGAELDVAVRTGDTPQRERQQMLRSAPDILITTPESLYLMLTGRALVNRRRDPRRRVDQARLASGADARAADRGRRNRRPADRSVGDAEPA